MAETTAISWADATFNPWMGCERVSPACARCYAETLTKNRMGIDVWGSKPRKVTSVSTWKKPEKWNRDAEAGGKRIRVFCASLADVFEELPELDEPRERLFELIDRTRSLDWMLLTKRPKFARDWLRSYYERTDDYGRVWTTRGNVGWGCLPNVWVGVSVENQRWTGRVDVLREIPAVVRFISAEPLLASLCDVGRAGDRQTDGEPGASRDQASLADNATYPARRAPLDLNGIDWLIAGGESGAKAARPMHPDWARELRDDAGARSIPFHFKQWGSWGPAPSTGGVRPGDVCLSPNGERDTAGKDYVCFANESEGEHMRFYGIRPDAGGNLLDGEVWDQVPGSTVLA